MWRWSMAFREWIDRRGTDVRVVERGDILAFLEQEDWGPGTRNRHQRITAINAVVKAARTIAPARARDSRARRPGWTRSRPVPPRVRRLRESSHAPSPRATAGDGQRPSAHSADGPKPAASASLMRGSATSMPFRGDYLESGRTSPGGVRARRANAAA